MADTLETQSITDCERFRPRSGRMFCIDPNECRIPELPQTGWRVSRIPEITSFKARPHRAKQLRGYIYRFSDNSEDSLPQQLRHISTLIDQSRTILDIVSCEDNGHFDCSEQTWIRATEFLTKNAKWVWDIHSHVIDTPHILPGPENSIDLHWDYSGYELLINIPADPAEMAGFYGDDHGVISIKGKFDPNKINHGLLLWLAEER